MASFHYRVLDTNGEVQTGMLDALDSASASAELHRRGWVPIELSVGAKTLSMRLNEPVQLFGQPNDRDIFSFLRDLARLLKAGLALDDGLKLLVGMQSKDIFVRILEDVHTEIRRGESLAAALSRHKDYFSIQVIASIQAGESAGKLAAALDTVATTMERSLSFRERLRSALIYPAILMIMVAATFVLVITFVIPQFGPLFEGNEDKLPGVTQFVMGLAGVFTEYWLIISVFFAGLVMWGVAVWHNPRLRGVVLENICKLPYMQAWILMPAIVRFTRTLGVCVQSGLALDKAIAMAVDTVKIAHVEVELARVRVMVRRGELLSGAIKNIVWFPALTVQFVKVGEQSGNLGDMLTESATILSQDYESRLEKALEVFSPVMTIVMGGIVALLVGSVLLGIMSINDVAL